jgi:hypothetical protein
LLIFFFVVENAREKTYEKWIIKSGKKKGTTEQRAHATITAKALSTGGRKRKSSGRSEEAEGESEREKWRRLRIRK